MDLPHRVEKPWGYELIWAKTDRYVGKILHIEPGHLLIEEQCIERFAHHGPHRILTRGHTGDIVTAFGEKDDVRLQQVDLVIGPENPSSHFAHIRPFRLRSSGFHRKWSRTGVKAQRSPSSSRFHALTLSGVSNP